VATVHTDASGSVTFAVSSVKGIGHYQLVVSAAGYTSKTISVSSTDHPVKRDLSVSQIVTLDRSAPALVFHTSTGSGNTQSAQAATVSVSLNNTTVLTDSTVSVAGQNYDAVMVPNLKASTTYSYAVSASGFATVVGTAKTPADNTAVEVDVQLVGEAKVEFDTSNAATRAAQPASVILTQGSLTFTTNTAGSTNGVSVGTVRALQPNTAFSYTLLADGFQTANGTGTTGASGSTTKVAVALQPTTTTVSVQFQTSAVLDTNGAFATSASITVSPGNFGTIMTQGDPTGQITSADFATVAGFAVGTQYSYSAFLDQFQATMTGSFTPTAQSSGPFVVQIQYNPNGVPTRALPPN
jgi:hypothetical protein